MQLLQNNKKVCPNQEKQVEEKGPIFANIILYMLLYMLLHIYM